MQTSSLVTPSPDAEVRAAEPGVLLFLNDVDSGMEVEFNRWYHEEFLEERLAIPGFERARRYRSVDGQPNYMAVFNCQSVEVLQSPAYRERLANPTEWTKRVMPTFRNVQRSACRETWSIGEGMGGAAIVVQCKPIHDREKGVRRFVQEEFGPSVMLSNCTVRFSLWEADETISRIATEETALRGGQDSLANWVLFIEGYDPGQMALALHTRILTGDAASNGLLIGSWMRYQLMCERSAQRPVN